MKKNISLLTRDNLFFVILLIWYIFKIGCYGYVGFSHVAILSHLAQYFTFGILLYCCRETFNVRKNGIISLITIDVVVSLVISIVYWNASPYYAIQSQCSPVGLLYMVVYFALQKWNVSSKTVQRVLIALSVIYLLCWGYSLYKMPEMVFGVDRDDNYGEITERGFYRLFIPGNVSAVLSFYFLGIFLYQKKKWGLYAAFGMLIIVILHVGRQMIAWTIVISAIMAFMHYKKKMWHLIVACAFGYIGLMFIAEKIPAVSAMMEMSKEQGENMDDDIRTEASLYFLFDYPHNIVTSLFGNGTPVHNSELSHKDDVAKSKGYYQTDVGFFAMFCNYGIIAVVLFGLLLVRVAKMRVEPEYNYLKYYFFYAYGTYLMSQSLTSSIFTVMMAYYVVEKSANNIKRNQS